LRHHSVGLPLSARGIGSARPSCENLVNSLFFLLTTAHSAHRHCASVRSAPGGHLVGDTPRVLGCRMPMFGTLSGQFGTEEPTLCPSRGWSAANRSSSGCTLSHAATHKSTGAGVAIGRPMFCRRSWRDDLADILALADPLSRCCKDQCTLSPFASPALRKPPAVAATVSSAAALTPRLIAPKESRHVVSPSLCKPSSYSGFDLASNERALRVARHDLEKFAQQSRLGSFAPLRQTRRIRHHAAASELYDACVPSQLAAESTSARKLQRNALDGRA
jgi:hypothetical protein